MVHVGVNTAISDDGLPYQLPRYLWPVLTTTLVRFGYAHSCRRYAVPCIRPAWAKWRKAEPLINLQIIIKEEGTKLEIFYCQ